METYTHEQVENIRSLLLERNIINKSNQVIKSKYKNFFGEEYFKGNEKGLSSHQFRRVIINKNNSISIQLSTTQQEQKEQVLSNVLSFNHEEPDNFININSDKDNWLNFFNVNNFTSNVYNRVCLYSNYEDLDLFIKQQANKIKQKVGKGSKNKIYRRAYLIYRSIAVYLLGILVIQKHSEVEPSLLSEKVEVKLGYDNLNLKRSNSKYSELNVFRFLFTLLSINNKQKCLKFINRWLY